MDLGPGKAGLGPSGSVSKWALGVRVPGLLPQLRGDKIGLPETLEVEEGAWPAAASCCLDERRAVDERRRLVQFRAKPVET